MIRCQALVAIRLWFLDVVALADRREITLGWQQIAHRVGVRNEAAGQADTRDV